MTRPSTAVAVLTALTVLVVAGGWAELLNPLGLRAGDSGGAVFITMAALAAPVLAWAIVRRHPDEWTGPLVGVTLLAAMLGGARGTGGALAFAAGTVALVTALLPAVVALRHPFVQTPPSAVRAIVICAVTAAATGGLLAVSAPPDEIPAPWWGSTHPAPASAFGTIAMSVHTGAVVAGGLLTVVVAISGYRALPRGGRPALRPMVFPLAGWSLAAVGGAVWTLVAGLAVSAVDDLNDAQVALFIMLPAVLMVLLAGGIGWIELMVRRPSAIGVPDDAAPGWYPQGYVQDLLSRALADPTIRVLYPAGADAAERWVDVQGLPAAADGTAADRASTLISRGDAVIGLIEHDAATSTRPDAVELVATGAGLVMETERLLADARRDLERSRVLASRLLSASDQPRAELRRQLVEGPLHRLEQVAAELAAGAPIADVIARLNDVAAQVRLISHGLFPSSLSAGGLAAALPGSDVPDHRYPAVVELTAYLAAVGDPTAHFVDAVTEDRSLLVIGCGRQPAPAVHDRVVALGGFVQRRGDRWSIGVPTAISADRATG